MAKFRVSRAMSWSFKQLSPSFARPSPRRALLVQVLAALALSFAGAAAQAAEPVKILAFGDSLTAGLGLSETEAMPAQLNQALDKMGRPALVINGGVSGDTSAGGVSRIDWALADKPQIMILALGANDMLRALDPASTRANLEAIIAKAQGAGVEIVLAGMLAPPNLGADYKTAFDALYPDLAKAHDLLFMPFLLQDVAQDSTLNQADGIHPNGKGVAIMVQHLLPLVTEAMDRVSKRGAT
jgi:acyl-CoA thioesterase-1